MEELLTFLDTLNGYPYLKLIVAFVVLVTSLISLFVSLKNKKVLGNSELNQKVSEIFKAMTVILPAVSILLDQKKGIESHEEKSDEQTQSR